MRHAGASFFGTRRLKDTLRISRCGRIENASNSPKVVGRDNHRSHELSPLSKPDRKGVVVNSTRETHRNIDTMDWVEGERKSVDLSGIELRVLELMRLGKTTKEIAATLCIPERTVELHIRHSLGRLRARSGEELLSLIRGYH